MRWWQRACLGAALVVTAATLSAPRAVDATTSEFVYASGNRLMLGGQPWRAVGVNQWDLEAWKAIAGNDEGCYYQHTDLDAYFDATFAAVATQLEATAVRTFGFMQFNTGGGEDFGSTDKLLYYARKHNVRVIPVLGFQYGICGEPVKDSAWYHGASPGYRDPARSGPYGISYRDYVKAVVARYKDDPTIAFWQLMNEAASYTDPTALTDFSRDMVTAIRTEAGDTNHLVTLGTKGMITYPRPAYAELLDCDATGGCNDLATAHDYSSLVPIDAMGYPSTVLLNGVQCSTAGCSNPPGNLTLKLDDVNNPPPADTSAVPCTPSAPCVRTGKDWTRLGTGIGVAPPTTVYKLRFTAASCTPWSVYVDDARFLIETNPVVHSFETGTDGWTADDPATVTVSQSRLHARTGTGSLRITVQPAPACASRTVYVSSPPLPTITRAVVFPQFEVFATAGFTAPIPASGSDSVSANMHDATVDRGKPFVMTETAIPGEVPARNPNFDDPVNDFSSGDDNRRWPVFACPAAKRSLGARAVDYERMMAFHFDEEHNSSGILFWDWKDPALLSALPNGTQIVDPMINCLSITPGDPAGAVVARWARQTPNPPLAAPAPLGTYPARLFVPGRPPASAVRGSSATVKVRMVRDGGNPFRGVTVRATGGCSGAGATDALGWVRFTCVVQPTAGSATVTLAPDPTTCGTTSCAGIAKSYALTVT